MLELDKDEKQEFERRKMVTDRISNGKTWGSETALNRPEDLEMPRFVTSREKTLVIGTGFPKEEKSVIASAIYKT